MNLILRSVVAGPYPYQSSLSNSSVLFGVSTNRQFDGTSIKQPTQNDYGVGFKEHQGNFANHKALSWVRIFHRCTGLGIDKPFIFRQHRISTPCKSNIFKGLVP